MNMNYRGLPEEDRYSGYGMQGEIQIDADLDSPLPIVYEDTHVALVDDKVRFPNGEPGRYLRIFHRSELAGRHGTVMLARQGRLYVLLRIFRHSTRAWELECPRGFAEIELSPEENARKEIQEELGVEAETVERLGVICPDTGLVATRAHLFLVELSALPAAPPNTDSQEAIGAFRILTEEEILREIADGQIRDGFTLSAVMIATATGRFGPVASSQSKS